jgi:hypothetical protein
MVEHWRLTLLPQGATARLFFGLWKCFFGFANRASI